MRNTIFYALLVIFFCACNNGRNQPVITAKDSVITKKQSTTGQTDIDTVVYKKLLMLESNGDTSGRCPVKLQYPYAGANFPFH
ncbi:MAG: hypothetical protein ICV66_11745, partial [Chitinophagaceae bacterium]|nr:hypothetical protein [Chitinophagaceae bacterium]